MKTRDSGRALGTALLFVMSLAFAASSAAPRLAGASARSGNKEYPREQTLVTAGNQWGRIAGFNPFLDNYAIGTVGLCYETLLRYDPLKDRYIKWLARSAKFTGKKTYVVVIREGIKWSDGRPLTVADVAWTFKLGRFESAPWHGLYTSLKSIKTATSKVRVKIKVKVRVGGKIKTKTKIKIKRVRNKVVFEFKGTPRYARWQTLIWNLPIVSRRQAGSSIRSSESLTAFDPSRSASGDLVSPVGTGPYTLDPDGFDADARVVWKKKKSWWAAKQKLAPSPRPRYVMDVSTSGVTALQGLLMSVSDLDNRFILEIGELISQGKAETYYREPPRHLSVSTTWLTPNTTHKPLDDAAFRRALARSIPKSEIVSDVYQRLVTPANATGLLPTWKKWTAPIPTDFIGTLPQDILAAAGYRDIDGDGYVENKDGSQIDLKLQVPRGWADWEAARDLIVARAATAGIRIHKVESDYDSFQLDRNLGAFDLIVDNTYQISDDPWTYFDANFHLPINRGETGQTDRNFQRYENQAAWALVQELEKTPLGKVARRRSLMIRIQEIFLAETPNIPLWYGGLWAQWQSKYWTSWPGDGTKRQYVPSMWRGYMQMTGIDAITHLKPTSS